MANGLNEALLALPMRPVDTIYGQLSSNVLQNIPNMINPYGSTWEAAGIGLGSVLTSALLGYQARKQAREENALIQPLLTQALQAKTPEEIDLLLQQPGAARMTDLGTQLKLSILQNKAAAEAKKAELAQELQLALVKEGYTPKGAEGLIDLPEAGQLTPKQQREAALNKVLLQQKQDIEAPAEQAKADAANKQRNADLALKLGERVASDPVIKTANQTKVFNDQLQEMLRTGTRASIERAIVLNAKITDANSTTTLGETQLTAQAQSQLDQLNVSLKNMLSPEPRIVENARKEISEAANKLQAIASAAHDRRVMDFVNQGLELGIPDLTPQKLAAPLYTKPQITREEALAELARRQAARGQ